MRKKAFGIGPCALIILTLVITGCHKSKDENNVDVAQLKKDILSDAAITVAGASYVDLSAKAGQLLIAVQTLNDATTDANLTACRDLWKSTRETWEQSEAWLIGPVEADDIDPRIDTWPVDFNDLNAVLASSATLDDAYMDGLETSLKGFHPIEYLLWGKDGNKAASSLTAREKEYLLALTQNLNKLCGEVKASWSASYANLLLTAGASGNSEFPTTKSAYETLVDAMTGICDEVAEGKMKDPFDQQDPTQEESPFAKNSIIDFTNNIKGILAMYQGRFITDGKGIEDLVRNYNLSLDNEIKTKYAAAISSLQAITLPFGEAIISQQTQVANAMSRISELAEVLDTKLKPFVQQYGQ